MMKLRRRGVVAPFPPFFCFVLLLEECVPSSCVCVDYKLSPCSGGGLEWRVPAGESLPEVGLGEIRSLRPVVVSLRCVVLCAW